MKHMFTQSLVWRAGGLAASAGRKIAALYRQSVLHSFINSFRRAWPFSGAHRILSAFITREPAVVHSRYARILLWMHHLAERAGTFFAPAYHNSRTVACVRRANAAVGRAADHSRIGRWVRKVGLRRWLIIGFALYLPLDFLLREVLGLADALGFWDEAFMLLAAGYVLLRRVRGRAARHISVTPLDGPLLLFIAAGVFLALFNAPVLSISIAGLRAVVQYMLWFFILIRLMEEDRDMWVFFGTMAALGTLLGLIGIIQYVLAVPIPATWVSQTELGVRTRVFGLTTSPNIMGCFMVMCAPLTAALAYILKKTWHKVLSWGATGIMCLSLLFTFSRGAWIGMAVAVVVFAVICDKRLFAFMLAAVPAAFMVPSIANRIAYLFTNDFREASSIGGRAIRWEVGMDLFSQNPVFGFGLGRFGGAVAMQNQVIESVDGFLYFYLDNYYLKTLVEMGIFGAVFFGLLLLALFLTGIKASGRARAHSMHYVPAGFFAGLCGTMAHMLTENILEVPYMNAYFWAFAAAIAYVGFLRKPTAGIVKARQSD